MTPLSYNAIFFLSFVVQTRRKEIDKVCPAKMLGCAVLFAESDVVVEDACLHIDCRRTERIEGLSPLSIQIKHKSRSSSSLRSNSNVAPAFVLA